MKTCLIVDDSKVVRRVASAIVRELGFEPLEAVDGRDALDKCGQWTPDAILLDWNMPVMSGPEFLEHLTALPMSIKPVVIFCTSETGFDRIEAALKAGAAEYVMKPFDRDIIESKFQQTGLLS